MKIVVIAGTRPEIIKLAPIVHELRNSEELEITYVHSAQHSELSETLDDLYPHFNAKPDLRLPAIGKDNSLHQLNGQLVKNIGHFLASHSGQIVVALGDTTTALATATCAHYEKKKFVHIEAGMRSFNKLEPFPEEQHRVAIASYADLHLAPTTHESNHLLAEGISKNVIKVVGSPISEVFSAVVDLGVKPSFFLSSERRKEQFKFLHNENVRKILVTAHRRENTPHKLSQLCDAVVDLAKTNPDLRFIWIDHPHPTVRNKVFKKLGHLRQSQGLQIHLIGPRKYNEMAWILNKVDLLITDSAGLMEEATLTRLPTIVYRDVTERPALEKLASILEVTTDTSRLKMRIKKFFAKYDFSKYKVGKQVHPYEQHETSKLVKEHILKLRRKD